jgi:hypothetical protein
LRQRPSRYAIRAGRNFVAFPCSQRDRLCLHLTKALEDRLRQISPLTTRVHAAGQPHDLAEAGRVSVFSSSHSLADVCEELEVPMLSGPQRIPAKVRNDPRLKQGQTSHLPLQCSIASVGPNGPAPEVPLEFQQHLAAIAILAHRDAGSDFPSDMKRRTRRDRDRKASLTVDISRDVRREINQIFLRARVLPGP